MISFNHGFNGLLVLFFGLIPYWLWVRSQRQDGFGAHVGLAAGVLYGLVMGLSLSLQAAAMGFAARGVAAHPELQVGYGLIGDWAMNGGGLSHSLYTIANLFLGLWLVAHSDLVKRQGRKVLGWAGMVLGLLDMMVALVAWGFLMAVGVNQVAHSILMSFEFLTQIWAAILGFLWIIEHRSVSFGASGKGADTSRP